MAVIGKIRKQSGLLIVFIGVALAAFILGDFFSNRTPGGNRNIVGEIDGDKITINEYNTRVDENTEAQKNNLQRENLTNAELFQVRDITWNQMLNERLIGKEYDKLGIVVTTQELDDLIRGNDPHPFIVQSFTDPQTGQFNPTIVSDFLKNFDQVDPQMRQRYLNLEKAIKQDRLVNKYNMLIAKAYYTPTAFAKRDYINRTKSVQTLVYAAPYTSVNDTEVTVTDADYQKYYNDHKYMYDQEASRDIEFVTFDVLPSADDQAKINSDVQALYQDFLTADNTITFVNAESDNRYDSTWIRRGVLPYQLDSVMFSAPVGTTYGPYQEGNQHVIARLMDVQSRPDSLRASHILVGHVTSQGPQAPLSKEQASLRADSILQVVRANPAAFEAIAASPLNNDQAAAATAGDLNWFVDGAMVTDFNNAVINGKVGDIIKQETPFGYHIIKITGKTAPVKKVRVALLTRAIEASSQTNQQIYTEASQFAQEAKKTSDFGKFVDEKGQTLRLAERVTQDQNTLPGIDEAREIVRWMYDSKTKVGDLSHVFDTDGRYLIARLKTIREKGIAPLEQVKDAMQPLVLRDKKAEVLMKKIGNGIKSAADLAKYASLGMSVDTSTLTYASSNIPMYGPEPAVVGTAFGMKAGQMSKPVKGNQGVYLLVPQTVTEAPEKTDFVNEKNILSNMFYTKIGSELINSLRKKVKITDNRLIFY